MPYLGLRETKLQSFQLKILYRIIPCNYFFKNLHIRETDICSYCDGVDSVEHFLYECNKVRHLWLQLCSWFHRELNIDIEVLQSQYFLGLPPTHKNCKIINSLILYFKYYVHRQKLFHDCEMCVTSLLAEIKLKIKTEKPSCALQNKTHLFNRRDDIMNALG